MPWGCAAAIFHPGALDDPRAACSWRWLPGTECDSVKDMVAANPEMRTVLVKTGKAGGDEKLSHQPEAWQDNINGAVDWIISKEADS